MFINLQANLPKMGNSHWVIVIVLVVAIQTAQGTLFKKMAVESLTLPVTIYKDTTAGGKIQCASLCLADGAKCQVYIFNKVTGLCKLANSNQQQQSWEVVSKDDAGYFNYGLFCSDFYPYLFGFFSLTTSLHEL